jgi:hypothetical protein
MLQVFCSTRKSVTQTVSILVGGLTLGLSSEQKTQILSVTNKLVDKKISGKMETMSLFLITSCSSKF